MINKGKFDSTIQQLKKVAENYNNNAFMQQLDELDDFVKNFNIKVLVVGHFNAGKSSLLNKFIGFDDLLFEDDNPTTAIATEIYPTKGECRYIGIRDDGSEEEIHPESKDSLKGFKKAKFYVTSPNLEKFEYYTFVDTPGYDSGVEAHNKALANYINNGSAFILVMDAQKGNLSSQDIHFLQEITQYSKNISLIVNKTDKAPNNVQTIIEECQNTLEINGLNVPVYSGSKWGENAADVISNAASSFNTQQIFDEAMKHRLQKITENFYEIINIMESSSSLNNYELDTKIYEIEVAKKCLQDYFETKKYDLANAMGERAVEAILDDVQIALNANEDAIVAAIVHNSEAAAQAVMLEAIRPAVINALKEVTAHQINDMVRGINFNDIMDRPPSEDIRKVVTNVAKNTQEFVNMGNLQKIGTGIDAMRTHIEKNKSVFKNAAAAFAILTDFINPVAEIVIVFLPDIIKLLSAALGPSEEDKIAEHIRAVIYPQIKCKLHAQLSTVVNEQCDKLIEILENSVNEKMQVIEQQLQDLRNSKEDRQSEYSELLQRISYDQKLLTKLNRELEA